MCWWNTMKNATTAASQNSTRSETQKLYRHVQQISQRLDLQLKQAFDWKEWFDVETLQLRQRVRDLCEHILLSGECDIARKTEEYLWRKGFYDIIQKLKIDKKKLTTNKSLNAVYTAHLQTAQGFYRQMLINLRNRYDIPVNGIIDWIPISQECEAPANITKEQIDWALKACQRCLIYLGDIARYQLDISAELSEDPEKYYHVAILLNSDNGMPHNQIGTVKQSRGFFSESAYHYMRCILSATRFEGAEENLKRVLEKHNEKVASMQERAMKKSTIVDVKTQFTASFLSLQEVLFEFRSISTEELAHWCQSVLSLFAHILTNSLMAESFERFPTKVNGTIEKKGVMVNGKISINQNHLTCDVLLKMLGMNILDVVKLKQNGSDLTSAATAFGAALLSQLLDFASQYLKQKFSFEIDPDAIKDSEAVDELIKLKKKLLLEKRKRRRRRRLSSEHSESGDDDLFVGKNDDLSDLSEGELSEEMIDESSDESGDSVIEEISDDENDLEVANITKSTPPNGVTQHAHKTSSLTKAGKLLNKQMKKPNKVHIHSSSNGVIKDFAMEDVEIINQATKLVDDFERLNEEAYLPVIKVFFDWLKINPDILRMSGKASPVLWQRIADVLNSLPSQKVVQAAVMSISQRRRLPLWLKGDLDDGTQHPQKRALNEDLTIYGTPGFEQLHQTLDITWFRGLSNSELYQFALRITYLRNFGHFICECEDVPCFSWNQEKLKFMVVSTSPTVNHVGIDDHINGNRNPKVMAQRNQMMKALAKQKLKHDVSQLQQQLKTTGVSSTEQASVYLVLDTAALCRHLSLLRQLVKSAQFVIIVPTQVISALDELKKYNPGARDAIKFLEDEIKHGNRWLKTQKEHETVSDQSIVNNRKKKNRDIEEWRFLHVVKCCIFFGEKHAGQSMVTLLTSDSSLQGGGPKTANMGTRPSQYALEICKNKGIRVEPVVDFYKRWTTRNGPS